MQASFGINMVALIDGLPKLLNLKEILVAFIRHRREVVTRRTIFLLRKARERAHILEGLAVALGSIDEVIKTIKASATPAEARVALLAKPWSPEIVLEMLSRRCIHHLETFRHPDICIRPRPVLNITCNFSVKML